MFARPSRLFDDSDAFQRSRSGGGHSLGSLGYYTVMKPTEPISSRLQNSVVREIHDHITPVELERLKAEARRYGSEMSWRFVLPLALVCTTSFWSWLFWSRAIGLILLPVFATYFVISVLPRMRAGRRRIAELTCETEWARSCGYRPEHLTRASDTGKPNH